jgi:5'-3' exonuclease
MDPDPQHRFNIETSNGFKKMIIV